MSQDIFNLVLAGIWVLIQVGILYYQVVAILLTRAAIKAIDGRNRDAREVAQERFRSQIYRIAAIIMLLLVGLIAALQLHTLRLVIGPALLISELVLFRNTRADVRLTHEIAARVDTPPPPADPGDPGVVAPLGGC